ncbi:uncharacterized protein LACBIDRAFT_301330 [Laccaria bicolor S238N-H82]|uniref:Predicted protein n=1 Tax=Laccaria bicolor (strain S238N-H82 / ATCC MYA-4686) TaxID=486041 RepID=B0CNA5_LACBS|nr:uncharacterized protein LACBIDRAFT_301330 [Laccaria bicolor S238N-H82]EDR15897.1 predicted protein [Laccaria bicolor S238N-H82]|eukprot:XP_001874105.1 predicted protein [Laccaria bicolor S238N-H82]
MNNNLVVTSIRLTPSKLHEVRLTGEERSNVPASFHGQLADSVAVICRTVAVEQTGAGRRFLSSYILTQLAAHFSSTDGDKIQIIPFDESDVIDMGPIVDFVVSKGGTPIGRHLVKMPMIFATNIDDMASHQFCAIFQTDHLTLTLALINQYVPLLEKFCRRPSGLNALRGCVTNGFDWKFFVFRVQNDKGKTGELLLFDTIIPYTDLPLLMGVLNDWVRNCRDENLQFCELVTDDQTEEMTQNEKENIFPQDAVSDAGELGQQADEILPKPILEYSEVSCPDFSQENIFPQDAVPDAGKLGQQADKILPRPKRKWRKAKKKQVSTQIDSQSLMVVEGDDSEKVTESYLEVRTLCVLFCCTKSP